MLQDPRIIMQKQCSETLGTHCAWRPHHHIWWPVYIICRSRKLMKLVKKLMTLFNPGAQKMIYEDVLCIKVSLFPLVIYNTLSLAVCLTTNAVIRNAIFWWQWHLRIMSVHNQKIKRAHIHVYMKLLSVHTGHTECVKHHLALCKPLTSTLNT